MPVAAGGRVRGEVVEVAADAYGEVLSGMDRMADHVPGGDDATVERVAREVRLANGHTVTAWAYLVKPGGAAEFTTKAERIPSGDWSSR